MAILALTSSAYDFTVDGLYYSYINGSSGNELRVTYKEYGTAYSVPSITNIPATINHNGKSYAVTEIGEYAFMGCSGLTSLTIPNTVITIEALAFHNCYNLNSVTFGNSINSIGNSAFSQCTSLTSIVIPNSVKSIGQWAFKRCSGLTTVIIGNSVTSIGGGAFESCNGLTSLTIGNSVTEIGSDAFYGCSGLTSVTIPNSVTSIGGGAFQVCSGLTAVDIPNSVTTIGISAFSDCSGLTKVIIGNSVTEIKDKAFYNCNKLNEIKSKIADVSKVTMGSDVFYYVHTGECIIYVPIGTADAYMQKVGWKKFTHIQEAFIGKNSTIGDLNCDFVVNGTDINMMVNQLLQINAYDDEDGATDIDGDGETTALDLNRMISIVLGQ